MRNKTILNARSDYEFYRPLFSLGRICTEKKKKKITELSRLKKFSLHMYTSIYRKETMRERRYTYYSKFTASLFEILYAWQTMLQFN